MYPRIKVELTLNQLLAEFEKLNEKIEAHKIEKQACVENIAACRQTLAYITLYEGNDREQKRPIRQKIRQLRKDWDKHQAAIAKLIIERTHLSDQIKGLKKNGNNSKVRSKS